jgi:hypothetical protein
MVHDDRALAEVQRSSAEGCDFLLQLFEEAVAMGGDDIHRASLSRTG